jgi:septum formation protein
MLILGSNSKRRKEILSYFGIPFRTIASDFDENLVPFQGFAKDYVQTMAAEKGAVLAKLYPDQIILTADTTVLFEGEILNKPQSLSEAAAMLKKMSGKEHEVFTGVCIRKGKQVFEGAESTFVAFNSITEDQIQAYIRHVDVLDKAGSYAIQGIGSILVKGIRGCYYNVMGLPMNTAKALLEKAGIDLWQSLNMGHQQQR